MSFGDWYRSFDRKTREWMDRLDVKKKLPVGYVNKWVFRGVLIFAFCFMLFVFFTAANMRLTGDPYLYCSPESGRDCINTFNWCYYEPLDAAMNRVFCPEDIDVTCNKYPYLCEYRTIPMGSYVGVPPPPLLQNASFFGTLFLLSAFPLNHLLYWLRRNKK